MKTIEELKIDIINFIRCKPSYCDGYFTYSEKELNAIIDEAVSIATKEAIERERARYIEKIIDSPLTSDFIEYINNKYFPPQPEVCEWEFIEGEIALLSCQKPHTTNLGALARMTYKFCPYCGKPIKVKED